MEKITEAINASIEWAATLCFRPFKLKKWIVLGFCSLMAGYLAGGNYNFSLPNNSSRDAKQLISTRHSANNKPLTPDQLLNKALEKAKKHLFVIGLAGFAFLIIFILSHWLWARFQFVFLENVVKNDASVRIPFRRNKAVGNSLFGFSLAIGSLTILIFALIGVTGFNAIMQTGVFSEGPKVGIAKIFLAGLPFLLLFLLLVFVGGIIYLLIRDFVVPVMYKDRHGAILACKKVMAIISGNKKETLLFVLFKLALVLISSILYSVIALAAFIGLLLPLGVLGVSGYLLFLVLPKFIHPAYFITLFILAVPVILSFWYFFICLFLPFAVFARTFSLKFLGRINTEYNLFKIQSIE